jgi:tetratricopeptide (TPR) repeat protein
LPLLRDLANFDSDAVKLLDAALAADPLGGPAGRDRGRDVVRELLALARQRLRGLDLDWQKAADALEFLHAQLLTGPYDPHCSCLQQTLDEGIHNCLMSTVLYVALCRDADLAAVALGSPGHVAVRVWLDGMPYDVETTDRRWRPHRSSIGQEISDQALLGRIYYNLGIRLAREGNFESSLSATRVSFRLDPSHVEARANLLATLNNRSVELARRGQFHEAEALVREGLLLDSQYAPLLQSEAYLRQRRERAAF